MGFPHEIWLKKTLVILPFNQSIDPDVLQEASTVVHPAILRKGGVPNAGNAAAKAGDPNASMGRGAALRGAARCALPHWPFEVIIVQGLGLMSQLLGICETHHLNSHICWR